MGSHSRIGQRKAQVLSWSSVSSPLGPCVIAATERGICWSGAPGSAFEEGFVRVQRWLTVERIVQTKEHPLLRIALDELEHYFAGQPLQFTCPLDFCGTPFQIAVWQEVQRIPYGETRSYGEIARAIGRPAASRAVGAANRANPFAVIVPCHRIIARNLPPEHIARLSPTKAWLLTLERALT